MAKILIAAGADPNVKTNVTVPVCLSLQLIVSLLDGQGGNTPLHRAALGNHCEVARILIAAGADLNAKNQVTVPGAPLAAADSVLVDGQDGNTPLHEAARWNHYQVAQILIAAGADLNAGGLHLL